MEMIQIMEFAGKLRRECRRGGFGHFAPTLFYLDMKCKCTLHASAREVEDTRKGRVAAESIPHRGENTRSRRDRHWL